MKINLEEGKVKCYERKNIGTLSQIGCKLSDNEKTPWPLRRVGRLESDRMSAVYQRNIWVITKRKTSEHLAELGAKRPIMQNATSITWSWTSGVRPDVRGMSEKYLSHNKKENIRTLGRVGCEVSDNAKCRIHRTELDIPESDRTSAVCRRNIWVVTHTWNL